MVAAVPASGRWARDVAGDPQALGRLFTATKRRAIGRQRAPAMRSAVIGVRYAGKLGELREYVGASTRLTHIDPRAETVALAVALTAGANALPQETLPSATRRRSAKPGFPPIPRSAVWTGLVEKILSAQQRQLSVGAFAEELGPQGTRDGLCISYSPDRTLCLAPLFRQFQGWVSSPVISCGGDTDTVGAITGAFAGAQRDDSGTNGFRVSAIFPSREPIWTSWPARWNRRASKTPPFHWFALPVAQHPFRCRGVRTRSSPSDALVNS